MRCGWVSLMGAGLCLSLVPACAALVQQPPANEMPPPLLEKGPERDTVTQAAARSSEPSRPGTANAPAKPAVDNETLVEPIHYPDSASGPDLIPEPRTVTAGVTAAKAPQPVAPDAEAGMRPEAKAKPVEDPALVQALRCLLDKRPDEAVDWLRRYDKSSQELLLCLLPLAVRVTEPSWQRYDSHEVSAVVDQLAHLADPLRPRAELKISKMLLYSEVKGYGKYRLVPDSYGFRPGEYAGIYVELQNLSDQRQGQAYRIHLRCTVQIRDLNGPGGRELVFDPGPDVSQSERHDFYHLCRFQVPKDLAPGLYILYLEIADVLTGRKAIHTLDFRVISAYGKRGS